MVSDANFHLILFSMAVCIIILGVIDNSVALLGCSSLAALNWFLQVRESLQSCGALRFLGQQCKSISGVFHFDHNTALLCGVILEIFCDARIFSSLLRSILLLQKSLGSIWV